MKLKVIVLYQNSAEKENGISPEQYPPYNEHPKFGSRTTIAAELRGLLRTKSSSDDSPGLCTAVTPAGAPVRTLGWTGTGGTRGRSTPQGFRAIEDLVVPHGPLGRCGSASMSDNSALPVTLQPGTVAMADGGEDLGTRGTAR